MIDAVITLTLVKKCLKVGDGSLIGAIANCSSHQQPRLGCGLKAGITGRLCVAVWYEVVFFNCFLFVVFV
jgi:hypothetical protein